MSRNPIFTTCKNCTRGFNLTNPLVELLPGVDAATCPHCGQKTEADAESMRRARIARAEVKVNSQE